MSLKDMNVPEQPVLLALVLATFLTAGYNTYQIQQMSSAPGAAAEDHPTRAKFSLPTGQPAAYGTELKVRYDDVSRDSPKQAQQVISKFASLDRQISLSAAQQERYVSILYDMEDGISCEYCCEAQAIVTKNGDSGCGCAHAQAMRGLTKYLLTEHPDMSNREIFAEIGKWKARFFPQQTRSKADALIEKGVEPTFVNVASNTYRGVQSSGGGWVGDC